MLIVSISVVVGTILLLGYAGLWHRDELRLRGRYAITGISVALALSAALLAYPVWFVLAGPAHLSGMVWSTNVPGDLGNSLGNFWSHLGQWGPVSARFLTQEAPVLGGYRGPSPPSPSYLGPGVLVVVAAGTVVWRSDRRLWFFGALGVVTAALSLRVTGDHWRPWSIVYRLPIFDNVVQSRFDAVFGLCAAVMVAIIVDHSRSSASRWIAHRRRSRSWCDRAETISVRMGTHGGRGGAGGGPGGGRGCGRAGSRGPVAERPTYRAAGARTAMVPDHGRSPPAGAGSAHLSVCHRRLAIFDPLAGDRWDALSDGRRGWTGRHGGSSRRRTCSGSTFSGKRRCHWVLPRCRRRRTSRQSGRRCTTGA